MKFFFTIMILSVMAATGASAKVNKLQGATDNLGVYGEWYATRSRYDNGDRVCFATAFANNRRMPTVSLQYNWSNGQKTQVVSFDVRRVPAANAKVVLTVGTAKITLIHPRGNGTNRYFPRSGADNRRLFKLIMAREKGGSKFFIATLPNGNFYNFSAKGAGQALAEIKKGCAK